MSSQRDMWHMVRERLQDKELQVSGMGCLSIREPGMGKFWFGTSTDAAPVLADGTGGPVQALHAAILRARPDTCAIASGCGRYGAHLLDIVGALPIVFDEQARHLGRLSPAPADGGASRCQLASGTNLISAGGELFILGMTGRRLVLNAELFEKCAQAHVLAAATGKRTGQLPWIVRHLANRRLMKDEARAARRSRQGLIPEETKGY